MQSEPKTVNMWSAVRACHDADTQESLAHIRTDGEWSGIRTGVGANPKSHLIFLRKC